MLSLPQFEIVEIPEMKAFGEEYIKVAAFAAEIEAGIRRAERETSASLGDNRFIVKTENHKWSVYIRRIDTLRSELEAELID